MLSSFYSEMIIYICLNTINWYSSASYFENGNSAHVVIGIVTKKKREGGVLINADNILLTKVITWLIQRNLIVFTCHLNPTHVTSGSHKILERRRRGRYKPPPTEGASVYCSNSFTEEEK